ncbi:MAG: hypothetical protein ABSD13_18295 [Candidatus Korobacteraceae bacterium]|jgi:hypothetical protein
MRARRRILIVSLCVLIFIAAVAAVVLLRKRAAPEAARLLPEADAVIYVDFGTVRNLTAFDQQPLPKLAPGYDEFVKNTGFAFERDLDEAAMAVHRGAVTGTARGATRYTEILVGHYDQMKLSQYLRQHSRSVESYRDVDVFSIPIENRTLRVALLAIDTVAVSNVDDPGLVHGIIDRFKKVALPFGGPRLVRTYFPKVPLGSLLWAIARIPASTLKPNAAPSFTLPGGIDIGIPGESDVVISLRMLTTIHARAEFYTQSEQAARNFTEQTTAFLNIFRGIEANTKAASADSDVKTVFDSLTITQKGERVDVAATIPPSFLRKLVNEPARNAVQGETLPSTPAAPSKK